MFPEGRAVELLIAAIVALIVVGPKDLPILLRKLGQFMAKVRSMAAEFRASFDEMARQSELDELRKEVEAMRKGQLAEFATHTPEMNQAFNEISQGLSDVGVELNSPAPYTYEAPQTTIEVKPAAKPRARKTSSTKAAAPKAVAAKTPTAPRKVAAAKAASPAKAPPKTPTVEPAAKAAPSKPRARKATVS
jgi:sec-independent protein translocase protein TatB